MIELLFMINNVSGVSAETTKTPDVVDAADKPSTYFENKKKRVDINVLKSKLQEHENKEYRKNMVIFISFLLGLGSLGIYLSI